MFNDEFDDLENLTKKQVLEIQLSCAKAFRSLQITPKALAEFDQIVAQVQEELDNA